VDGVELPEIVGVVEHVHRIVDDQLERVVVVRLDVDADHVESGSVVAD
jgi:hypothetical protein